MTDNPLFWEIAVYYLAAVNLLSLILTVADKRRARRRAWRVPEATLLLFAALGGSPAMLVTMLVIRHKTRKPKFMVGIPCILVLQTAAIVALAWFFL